MHSVELRMPLPNSFDLWTFDPKTGSTLSQDAVATKSLEKIHWSTPEISRKQTLKMVFLAYLVMQGPWPSTFWPPNLISLFLSQDTLPFGDIPETPSQTDDMKTCLWHSLKRHSHCTQYCAALRSAAQYCSNRLHANQLQHSHCAQYCAARRSIAQEIRNESD